MHKCGMWKPNTNNEAMLRGVLPMEGHQKEIQYPELLGREREVEKIKMFLKNIEIFEET